jgi:hypothetical protein
MSKFNLSDIKKSSKQNIFRKEKDAEKNPKQSIEDNKNKSGRPLKKRADKLTKKVTVNFTEAEFNVLQKKAEEYFNISLSKLIRNLLKQSGDI